MPGPREDISRHKNAIIRISKIMVYATATALTTDDCCVEVYVAFSPGVLVPSDNYAWVVAIEEETMGVSSRRV